MVERMAANAKRLPSGNYRAQIPTGEKILTGKKNKKGKEIIRYKYISVTAPTKEEAELIAAEYKFKNKTITQNPADMILSEAMEKYIESKSNVLSPETIAGYYKIKRNDLQNLMPLKLNKLNNNIIQSAINDESKKHSPKTVSNTYGLLVELR